jgi:hypothetical protein
VVESFWASYKAECLPEDDAFDTRAQAKSETFGYIEVFTPASASTRPWAIPRQPSSMPLPV